MIAQYGGCKAIEAWQVLCHGGAFPGVSQEVFAKLLRELARHDLIVQASDGTLLLGVRGERIVNHYSFYTAFITPTEYLLVSGGRELGTLPISHPLSDRSYIIFAGQRWQVLSVDVEQRIVQLEPSPAGRVPRFSGGGVDDVHERVRQEMKTVYESTEVPPFLDSAARVLLQEGRDAFGKYQLGRKPFVEYANNVALFCWAGDRVLNTILVQLAARNLPVSRIGMTIVVEDTSAAALIPHLSTVAAQGPEDATELASTIRNKLREKNHPFLNEELLSLDYASSRLDTEGSWQKLIRVLAQMESV